VQLRVWDKSILIKDQSDQ